MIAANPTHSEALYLLSRCQHDRGHTSEALELALQAVSALASHPLPPAREYPLWGHLNAMFTQALAGLDGAANTKPG